MNSLLISNAKWKTKSISVSLRNIEKQVLEIVIETEVVIETCSLK